MRILLGLLACGLMGSLAMAQVPNAITADPAPDKAFPAGMETFQIPSHGVGLNALLYEASGAGPHGTVVLLHGFPGNEKNLDLAQAMRRDGWNVLYFNYRGSWGTLGAFSFEHCMEDAAAAVAFLRDPANAKKYRVDAAQMVVMGHSMGGMIALYTAAHDAKVLAVATISAADMAGHAQLPAGTSAEAKAAAVKKLGASLAEEGLSPLAGCTPEGLAAELMAHPEWVLQADAAGLAAKPVLLIASDDGTAPATERLAAAIQAEGNQELKYVHLATDHPYSDKRIELETVVLGGLDYLKTR